MANQQIINDWLNSGQYSAQDLTFIENESLFEAIFKYLEHFRSDEQLLEPLCNKLYSYYRSNDDRMVGFCLSFIPTLIGVHIMNANNCSISETHKYRSVDVLLLGIYNLSVVDSEGRLVERTFRLMSLSKPSIYHEPSPHSSAQNQSSLLTEHNISKLDNICGDINVPVFGPYLEIEQIVANNRMDVMTVLMKIYNQYISSLSKQSLFAFCRMSLRLIRQGSINISVEKLNSIPMNALFDLNELISRKSTKIALSSQFLVEITNSIYFCLFNDVTDLGFEALEEIHNRAVNQLYSDVLLMTNAIRNSLLINSGQPSDGPMGINVALSPTTSSTSLTTTGIAKIAITNASFKSRKLPDDIPIVVTTANTNTTSSSNIGSNPLGAINEETEETGERSGKSGAIKGVTAGIGKMGVIQKLKDIKDKKKEANMSQKSAKYRAENGDIVNNKLIAHEDSGTEYGSDTSGISDTKMSFSEETIPLNVLNPNKTYFEPNDEDVSDSSHNSCDSSAKVPLVSANASSDPITQKHNNNETSVNV